MIESPVESQPDSIALACQIQCGYLYLWDESPTNRVMRVHNDHGADSDAPRICVLES